MKHLLPTLFLGLAACSPVLSQDYLSFRFDFNQGAPPHSPGVPESAALLEADLFSIDIYLSTIRPTAARIMERGSDGEFVTVFDVTGLVYAGYGYPPPGGIAYSWENSWRLNDQQILSLMKGNWYAEVAYPDSEYLGQILLIPEPSIFTLLACGLVPFVATRRRVAGVHTRSATESALKFRQFS